MNPRVPQVNFSKGELAPQLYARWDVDAWAGAVKQARNVTILKYGGLTKRPGHRLVAEVIDDSEEQRLIPFEFSLTQTYALEFGQGYAQPMALGGRVVEEALTITAITAAANAQITAAFHGYAVGEQVYISGLGGEMGALLNGRFWTVMSAPSASTFTINANTVGLTFTTDTGGITRTGAPDPPPTVTVPPVVPPPDPPETTPPGEGRPLNPYEEIP
jgi:hypothetical protein